MTMRNICIILVLAVVSHSFAFNNIVEPNCDRFQRVCEYNWTINYIQTMVINPPSGKGSRQPVVPVNGTLYARTNCGSEDFYRKVNDSDYFITGDGISRMAFAINRQIPGPSIVAYKGQQIVVNIRNDLWMEGVTIHWHGLTQRGTPFMDGVARVTQCPINPGETFIYRFIAEPKGTFWYHSHLGTQRSDGLAGALIVLENKTEEVENGKNGVSSEFIFLLYDWFEMGAATADKWAAWDINRFSDKLKGKQCFGVRRTYDYAEIGQRGLQTPAINAKGRRYDENGTTEYPFIPLEVFKVQHGNKYRFRIISVAAMNAYRISIDNHKLKIIAVDGADVEDEIAESVILHSAERVDIEIHATAPNANYWIRMEDMAAKDTQESPINMRRGYGILSYEGAGEGEPTSLRSQCTPENQCKVINCLFGKFPQHLNTVCVPISSLKSTSSEIQRLPVPIPKSKEDFQEFFLNFHFSKVLNFPKPRSSINGIKMSLPPSPLLVDANSPESFRSCESHNCSSVCTCTHMLELKLENVIQIVLVNHEPSGFGRAHPVHMHGHRFHVMKVGFPVYDPVTGNMTNMNGDIKCNSIECQAATWTNESWLYGNVPGMNVVNPPLKDTVIVPWGGYVVLRILADNPGYWYLHCHIELHNVDGMALVLKEGNRTQMPPIPKAFRTCGNTHLDQEEIDFYFDNRLNTSVSNSSNKLGVSFDDGSIGDIGGAIDTDKAYITALITFLCISMIINIVLCVFLFTKHVTTTTTTTNTIRHQIHRSDEKQHLLS